MMFKVAIRPDGLIQFVYADDLRYLMDAGTCEIRRVSHVEPCKGGWCADMRPVDGPFIGPFELRSDALKAELEYLEKHFNL